MPSVMRHVARRGQLLISSAIHNYLTYLLYMHRFKSSPSFNKIPRPVPPKKSYAGPVPQRPVIKIASVDETRDVREELPMMVRQCSQ